MPAPRLVYLVAEDRSFLSRCLPMARAAKAAGFEVHVVTEVTEVTGGGRAIEREGFLCHPTDLTRGSTRPGHLLAAARAVRARYRQIGPALVHHVGLQPVAVGRLAAAGLGLAAVNAVTGVGALVAGERGPAGRAIAWLLPRLLAGGRTAALVENPDDRALLERLGVRPAGIALVPGAGVDVAKLQPMPEPDGPVTVAYAGPMVAGKGVRTLIEAIRRLRGARKAPRLLLAGRPDPSDPGSIAEDEIRAWTLEPGVEWLGEVDDMREVWRRAHVAVLASRREGLPMSLVEAAACGRALAATDVPGCREVARAGVNALTFPAGDPDALGMALKHLAADDDLRRAFAAESRRLAVEEFSAERIGRDIVELYHRLCRPAR